ncbi:MAG: cytochrome c [Gemmatimonadota bacterium]
MLVAIAAFTVAPRHALSQRPGRTVWDSVYTEDQATRGKTGYNQNCAKCHQASLEGADESPALVGGAFLGNWNGYTVGDVHERVRTTMPKNDPGIYGRQLISDVLAYVLKSNGFPAGSTELPTELAPLKEIRIESKKP